MDKRNKSFLVGVAVFAIFFLLISLRSEKPNETLLGVFEAGMTKAEVEEIYRGYIMAPISKELRLRLYNQVSLLTDFDASPDYLQAKATAVSDGKFDIRVLDWTHKGNGCLLFSSFLYGKLTSQLLECGGASREKAEQDEQDLRAYIESSSAKMLESSIQDFSAELEYRGFKILISFRADGYRMYREVLR